MNPLTRLADDTMIGRYPEKDKSVYCKSLSQPSMHKVFVYGTLKRGYGLADALEKSTYIGLGFLKGYIMISLGAFPAIYKDLSGAAWAHVSGECYEVDDHTLSVLDQIESVKTGLYRREPVFIEGWNWHWCYVQDKPTAREWRRVTAGRWEGPGSPTISIIDGADYPATPIRDRTNIGPWPPEWQRNGLPDFSRDGEFSSARGRWVNNVFIPWGTANPRPALPPPAPVATNERSAGVWDLPKPYMIGAKAKEPEDRPVEIPVVEPAKVNNVEGLQ